MQPPTSLNTAEELFSFTGGSIWSGFKGSIAQNSLFLTNFNWLPSDGLIRGFKFDLGTNTLSSFTYNQDFVFMPKMEIIDDTIYTVSGSFYQNFDFEFNDILDESGISNTTWHFGSASQDDDVYLFSGRLTTPGINEIGRYNVAGDQVDILATLPGEQRDFSDGEIVNNKLYILGGDTEEALPLYNNYAYDISTGSIDVFTSPIRLTYASTAVVENLIYAGGMSSEDLDNNGTLETFAPHLEVFNTQNNTLTEIAINFQLLESERLYNLWASEDFIYLVLTQNQTGGGANLRVVRAPLN